MTGLQEGQIYRWRWTDEVLHEAGLRGWSTYHCKSQIAVVHDGRLFDTYWSDMSRALDPKDVELTFMCDTSWPTISEGKIPYYDPCDIADTRHPNNSRAPIYLRPGAKYSVERLMEEIAYREEKARSEIRSAEWELQRLAEARLLVEAGKIDEVYL